MGDLIIKSFLLVSAFGMVMLCFVAWLYRKQAQDTEESYDERKSAKRGFGPTKVEF